MKLSSAQASAVEAWGQGDVCVVAGPGSGKTTVLVERFRWLVEEKGISPAEILAITFTEKAANNMLERLTGNRAPSGSAPPAGSAGPLYQTAQILTIDAFCARLLREHALPAGLDPNFQVLESWQADMLLKQAIDEELNKVYAADPAGTRRFLEVFAAAGTYRGGMDLSQVHNQILNLHQMIRISGAEIQTPENSPAISRARDELAETLMQLGQRRGDPQLTSLGTNTPPPEHHADPAVFGWFSRAEKALKTHKAVGPDAPLIKKLKKDLLPACRAEFLTRYHHGSRVWLAGVVQAAAANYESLKHRGGWVDFSDLESLAIRLLESEPARRPGFWPGFGHVLVDEYQDTNPLQGKLIGLLRSGEGDSRTKFFAVGDINQSIYGFRHADPDVFRNYRHAMLSGRGVVISLLDNFRSRSEILKFAEHLLSDPDGGVEPQTLVARRDFAPKPQPSVEVLVTRDPQGDRARQWEVRRLAGRIRELMESLKIGKPERAPCWADFAVLLRSRTLIDRFAEGFRQESIPYELSAGQGFFETTEVRDLVNLLRTLRNPHDDIALAATLCSPFAGASDEDLFRMRLASGSAGLVTGLYPYSETPAGRGGAAEVFAGRLAKYRSLRDEIPLDVLLSRFLHECGYETGLLQSENGRSKLANVRKFLRIVRQIASARDSRFSETVQAIVELQESGVNEAEATGYDEKTDAVRLMTLHAAKGLEFPVVILPALDSSPPNTASAVSYSPAGGIGAKWVDPADGNAREDTPLKEFLTEQREKNKKEGDRLFYVAITRAEEHLLLSASFGPRSPLKHWAKLIKNKLDLDFKTVGTEPAVKQYEGYAIRYCVSDEEPEPGGLAPIPAASEVEWVQPREGFEQHDSEIAITSVALFRQCPRKYFLSRYLGLDSPRSLPAALPEQSAPEQSMPERSLSPVTGQPPASQFGRRVHEALAGSPLDEQSEPEVAALVHAFEQSDLGRQARQAKAVARELTVVFPVGRHILRGQIDLWFDDGESQVLVDYKTDHVSGEEISNRAGDYTLQVQLYAMSILGAKGRLPDRGILYFLRPSVAVDVDLSPQAMEQARQTVAEVFSAQSSLDFPMHEGPQCQRCGYYQNLCPAE